MKFFDCFMYHDEDLVLDMRLNILNQYVDKFVIIESRFDHQGNKKELNFDFSQYKKFKDKIIYKIIDEFPPNFSD
ncbi:glycosyl transferase family 17, partial [Candidatus Pelagibacter bacterium]|nr:glycosyl transferase family 17 [Candidatus Pelagibacter bacterium]